MADRETELVARIASGVSDSMPRAWDGLPGGDPFLSHAFLVALENSGSVGPGTGWTPAPILVEDEARTRRRRAGLSQDATARANMCSTMAGPRHGSAPAAPIIPSCRSRCRSRRCPGRGCSASRPQHLLAAIEAVTVQNDMSSAHITFIDEAGAAECRARAAG